MGWNEMDPRPAQAAPEGFHERWDKRLATEASTRQACGCRNRKEGSIIKPSYRGGSSSLAVVQRSEGMQMLMIIWYILGMERNEPYRGFDRRLIDVKLKRMDKEGKPLVRIG
jgi:hypothetical protein